MPKETYRLKGTVIAVYPIGEFSGVVISTFPGPKFVIAIRVDDSKHKMPTDNANVQISVFDVVFYAVPSVSALFGTSEVVGKSFAFECNFKKVNGQEWHLLSLV